MDSKLYLPERLALGLERPAIVIAITHEASNEASSAFGELGPSTSKLGCNDSCC